MARKQRRAVVDEDEEEEVDMSIDEGLTAIDPYETLSIERSATQEEVKSAYRKLALRYHPDKAGPEEKDAAHAKFQEIAFAYAILSDVRRRKRYDTTGRTEESLELDDDDDFSWATFFREQFAEMITAETIDKFAESYKGGEEERGHVLAAYTKYEGNMSKVYTDVMLSDVLEDDERFRGIIDQAIADGEVENFKRYSEETEKSKKGRIAEAKKRRSKESKEVDSAKGETESKKKGKKEKGEGGLGDLAALIQQRQHGRAENFFDKLEEKYAPKGKKRGKPAVDDEPPEEAFAKNRALGKKAKR